jgi:NAD(P)H-dependent nitrite reductase small subunit
MGSFMRVAKISEISPGKSKLIDVEGRPIAIYNAGGTFYATDNYCPHKGGPLHEGVLMGNMVICPWHSWTFDVTNGKCLTNPIAKVSCFQIKVEGDDLLLEV